MSYIRIGEVVSERFHIHIYVSEDLRRWGYVYNSSLPLRLESDLRMHARLPIGHFAGYHKDIQDKAGPMISAYIRSKNDPSISPNSR